MNRFDFPLFAAQVVIGGICIAVVCVGIWAIHEVYVRWIEPREEKIGITVSIIIGVLIVIALSWWVGHIVIPGNTFL